MQKETLTRANYLNAQIEHIDFILFKDERVDEGTDLRLLSHVFMTDRINNNFARQIIKETANKVREILEQRKATFETQLLELTDENVYDQNCKLLETGEIVSA
jgi:hypothetical protein